MSSKDFNGTALDGYYPRFVDGIDAFFEKSANPSSEPVPPKVELSVIRHNGNHFGAETVDWVDMFPHIPSPDDPDFGKDGFCFG